MLLFFQHKMSLLIFLFSYLLISLVHYLSIYILCLSVCFFDCLLVSNNCHNGWTDRAEFFCGTSRDSREGLWMIEFLKMCLSTKINFEKFWNSIKVFLIDPRVFVLFYNVYKGKIFRIEIEDGCEECLLD